jgi:hypothetical protein
MKSQKGYNFVKTDSIAHFNTSLLLTVTRMPVRQVLRHSK